MSDLTRAEAPASALAPQRSGRAIEVFPSFARFFYDRGERFESMKEFWCGAVIPNCQARFRGENEADILRQVAAHAAHDHGISEVPKEVVEQVRARIREAG